MKSLIVLITLPSGPEPPEEVKTWAVFGCIAVVALAFWYFVWYKE